MILEVPRRRQPPIPLTPLIDVVFNILTFFIVFTVFRGTESAIGLRLPRAATGQQQAPAPLVVTVREEGYFLVNGREFDGESLRTELAGSVGRNPEGTVIVKADRNVRYELLVEALDAVRENGGAHIALAVEPKPAEQPGSAR